MSAEAQPSLDRRNGAIAALLVILVLLIVGFLVRERGRELTSEPPSPPSPEAIAEEKIRSALAKQVAWKFTDKPLNEFTKFIEAELGVPVYLHVQKLEEAAIASDTPLQLDCANCSASAAIDRLFEPLQLDWTIHNESIWIATIESIVELMDTRVYDVRDLVQKTNEDGELTTNFEPLRKIITESGPGPWKDSHGEGGVVNEFRSDHRLALVVTHTRRGHEQIEFILSQLRRGLPVKPSPTIQLPADTINVPTAPQKAGDPMAMPCVAPLADPKEVVEGNNRFAFDFYSQLRMANRSNNLFVSPYSISVAMAMLSAGTAGETQKEITKALHFPLNSESHLAAFNSLRCRLAEANQLSGIDLRVANRVWIGAGLNVYEPFGDALLSHFDAETHLVNFSDQSNSLDRINSWAKEATAGRIRELYSREELTAETQFVLANVTYFKGTWDKPFDTLHTKPAPFHSAEGTVSVPMMHQKSAYQFAEREGIKILELPYVGSSIAMVILLPTAREKDAASVEKVMTTGKLTEWLGALKTFEVEVDLPKFQIESTYNLIQEFARLGLTNPFHPGADLSRISDSSLFVHLLKQKAILDVNELGTEAAAVTGGGGFGGLRKLETAQFRADHPFVFLIRDNKTDSILFLGRFSKPPHSDKR